MAGIGGYDGDDVVVKGDDGSDDGLKISAFNDGLKNRLCTDAITSAAPNSSVAIIPADNTVYEFGRILNAGSDDMTVDGSVTPVNFDFGPSAGQKWYCNRLGLLIFDNGTNDPEDFGSITNGLTNGIELVLHIDSTDVSMLTIKTNFEIGLHFSDNSVMGQGNGFLNQNNAYAGIMGFSPEVTLDGDDGDYIRVIVRDNLTAMNFLKMTYRIWRILP